MVNYTYTNHSEELFVLDEINFQLINWKDKGLHGMNRIVFRKRLQQNKLLLIKGIWFK